MGGVVQAMCGWGVVAHVGRGPRRAAQFRRSGRGGCWRYGTGGSGRQGRQAGARHQCEGESWRGGGGGGGGGANRTKFSAGAGSAKGGRRQAARAGRGPGWRGAITLWTRGCWVCGGRVDSGSCCGARLASTCLASTLRGCQAPRARYPRSEGAGQPTCLYFLRNIAMWLEGTGCCSERGSRGGGATWARGHREAQTCGRRWQTHAAG